MPRKTITSPLEAENAIQSELRVDELDSDQLDDSDLLSSSEDSVHYILADSKNRNLFLTKVGLTMTLHFMVLVGMCIFILLDVRHTRLIYRNMRMDSLVWLFLSLTLIIKVAMGFMGHYIRVIDKVIFLIDTVFASFLVIGLYYYLDEKASDSVMTKAPLVIFAVINLFVASFVFTLTTFYKSRSRRYNFFIGTGLMWVATTGINLGLYFGWRNLSTVTIGNVIGIIFIFAGIDLYIALNAYLIVNRRTLRFYDNDMVFCFNSYFIDWFSFFWIDIFSMTAGIRKKLGKKRPNVSKNEVANDGKKSAKKSKKEDKPAKKSKKEDKKRASKNDNNEKAVEITKKVRKTVKYENSDEDPKLQPQFRVLTREVVAPASQYRTEPAIAAKPSKKAVREPEASESESPQDFDVVV